MSSSSLQAPSGFLSQFSFWLRNSFEQNIFLFSVRKLPFLPLKVLILGSFSIAHSLGFPYRKVVSQRVIASKMWQSSVLVGAFSLKE